MSWIRRFWYCVLAAGLLLPAAPTAAVDTDTALLRRIRHNLRSYGEHYGVGLDTLDTLAGIAARASEPKYAAEARFLRAAVAADLYFLSVYGPDPALRSRLAAALSLAPETVFEGLGDLLADVAQGLFAEPGTHVRVVLDLAAHGTLQDLDTALAGPPGTAGRAVMLRRVAEAVKAGTPLWRLATRLGDDPCDAQGQGCPEAMAAFSPESRRRLQGLWAIGRAYSDLSAAAEAGDPLARALLPSAVGYLQLLSAERVLLAQQLSAERVSPAAGDSAGAVTPRLFLVVTATGVQVSRAPAAQLNVDGAAEVLRNDRMWPATEALPVPQAHWGPLRHVPAVAEALRPVCAGGPPDHAVAIVGEAGAKAVVFSALLHALSAADCRPVALLGRGPQDMPVGVRLEIVAGDAARPRPIRVHVRPGGYTIERYGRTEHWPRTRQPSGALRQPFDRLQTLLTEKHRAVTSVSFARGADMADVADVLWRAASKDAPVRVTP